MERSGRVVVMAAIMAAMVMVVSCGGDEGGQDRSETHSTFDALAGQDRSNMEDQTKKTNVGPQIQIISPSSGSTVSESSLRVSWTAVDNSGVTPSAELSIRNVKEGGPVVFMPKTESKGTFTWAGFSALPAGDYEIQLISSDGSLSNTAFSRIKKP